MSENIEYTEDEERRRARHEEIVRRRRLAKQRQIIKRKIVLGVLCFIVIGLVVFGIVKGVGAIAHHFSNDNPNIQNGQNTKIGGKITSNAESDLSDLKGIDGTDNSVMYKDDMNGDANDGRVSQDSEGYLGQKSGRNNAIGTGTSQIGSNAVFEGYKVNTTDSTYYYASEEVQSSYAILIDASTGDVVCQKDGFVRINPASMTKILTVLVAAEHLKEEDLKNKVKITIEDTDYCYSHDLSAVGFDLDEEVTIEDLFYGTILPSGADAAIALARYVAGDEPTFIAMMNAKLDEMGLASTSHFTNCVGLFDENHYSTCADMAMILKAAMENEYCAKVLSGHTYTTSSTVQHPDGITISNWFLRRIEDKDTKGLVVGAKTGYVNQAGSCAASYSVQDSGIPYFCVTAQAHSAWRCIYDQVDIYYNCAK